MIRINNVSIGNEGYIGKFNSLAGPFDLVLAEKGALGNGNKCYRSPIGVSYGTSVLKLGVLSKITGNHRIDCTRSVIIGDFAILAGHNSQLWTHAYYHDTTGPGRFRLDGDIEIGNNVYIGSGCIVNCGVKISDATDYFIVRME